jgi:hypothetical protein
MKKTLTLLIFMSFLSSFYSQTILWSEDCETDPVKLLVLDVDNSGTTWGIASSAANAHGGLRYMTSAYNVNGSPNNDELITSTSILCPANQTITWSFWAKSFNTNFPETFRVNVSSNNGATWTTIATETNIPATYINYSYNLSSYAGQSIKIKIVHISVDMDNLFVDDLSLIASPLAASPTVSTTSVTSIANTSATSGGNVTAAGTAAVTARGVCWSTSQNPTTANSKTVDGTGTGIFSSNITGLTPNTAYYVRAYATSTNGTSYGNQFTFTTLNPCSISQEVFLTNIAFLDQATANNASTYFSTYSLPSTIAYNSANPNNYLDVGKPVRFKIQCKNLKQNGNSIVSGLCKLRTTDPNITITDSLAGLNNVGYNSQAWSQNEFEIVVSNTVTNAYTAYVDFIVQEGATEYKTKCIPIPVKPFLSPSHTIDDDSNPDSQGNGNLICESGEIIETLPYLNNASQFNASYVAGFLKNLDGLSGINIKNNVLGSSGTIYAQSWWNFSFGAPQPINAGLANTQPEYDFVFDYNYPSTYQFKLYLEACGGFYLFGANNNSTLIRTSIDLIYNLGSPSVPITVGVAENDKIGIQIFPNPTKNVIIINHAAFVSGKNSNSVKITNLLGQNLYTSAINNNSYTIDLSTIGTTGIYFIEILDHDNKTITNKKIILE